MPTFGMAAVAARIRAFYEQHQMEAPAALGGLGLPLLGVVPDSKDVLTSSNMGQPVAMATETDAGRAYGDIVKRFLGEDVPMRFTTYEPKGFLARVFGS